MIGFENGLRAGIFFTITGVALAMNAGRNIRNICKKLPRVMSPSIINEKRYTSVADDS